MISCAEFDRPASFAEYDALGLAELIARHETSPNELLRWAIASAEVVNTKINCLAHTHYEEAWAQIARGVFPGIFHGVPFILKDLGVSLGGTITSSGSLAFKNYKPRVDCELVSRYKRAGLVIFAKSTTSELGLTFTAESKAFGLTRNPWDLRRSTGGSSGGSAAAVASRIVPMAHASDGGGSIRVPASCTGLFGFKPSRGRMPVGPTIMESWLGLSTSHAITRSVRDSAALLDATCGAGLTSALATPSIRGFLEEIVQEPRNLRVALMLSSPTESPIDSECIAAATYSARLCESLGHSVDEIAPTLDSSALNTGFQVVIKTAVAQALRDRAHERGSPVTSEEVEAVTWMFANQGRKATALMIADAKTSFDVAAIAMADFLKRYDVILSPTLAKIPAKLGVLGLSPQDWATYTREATTYSPFTGIANMTGQPSMSVPLFWTSAGLPVGTMFTGRWGDDRLLLRLAAQLEKS
jgi:amidase